MFFKKKNKIHPTYSRTLELFMDYMETYHSYNGPTSSELIMQKRSERCRDYLKDIEDLLANIFVLDSQLSAEELIDKAITFEAIKTSEIIADGPFICALYSIAIKAHNGTRSPNFNYIFWDRISSLGYFSQGLDRTINLPAEMQLSLLEALRSSFTDEQH